MVPSTAWRSALLAAGLALAPAAGAVAAEPAPTAPSELLFLGQIVALVLLGRLLGEAMQRIGQPAVMGQLLAGLLLGPSVLGLLWPAAQHALFPSNPAQKAMLDGVAQLGVLMLLLLTGMETDLKLVRRIGRAAVSVSLTGILLPFACGFALGQALPDSLLPHPEARLVASLFLGTALSISSVKIVAMVVREMNFSRRNIGQIILASAIIDDTIGWIIIAVIFSLAGSGTIDVGALAQSLLGTALFLALSLTVGRRIVFALIRWTNDNFVSEVPVISVILLVMGGMALTTHAIGVHTVLGAFVAGVLVGESPILTREIDEQLRGLITALFAPVFFGVAGLSADLTILGDTRLLALTGGLVLIASVGKFAGAFIGGELGGLRWRESLALASGMNARGSTEVIIATIGLSMGVLSRDLFTMIVAMAILTTMAMPPMLRAALRRLPLGRAEKERLEREALEATSFLPNVERLLLAVDNSANGKFASRLAGCLAGARGLPVTVLQLGRRPKRAETADAKATGAEAAVKAGAKTTAAVEAKVEEQKPAKVPITTREGESAPDSAVAEEARKGYDMLVVGLAKTLTAKGAFQRHVARTAGGFDGPLAVVIARGDHLERPTESRMRILLPVTGTPVSRRATEIAVALARANDAPLAALYVASSESGRRRATATRRHEEEILKDTVALADRYRTPISTALRVDVAPDEAILREAARGNYDLIVMGVNRRQGDTLFFGNVAASVLAKAAASVLFVTG
jgi:Kef-type K+ transport system membrane component KefB/nucleotide-binding universal stress UspA family protein